MESNKKRGTGKALSVLLAILSLLSLLCALCAPMAVLWRYRGLPEAAALWQLPLISWTLVWGELWTAVPTVTALAQTVCLSLLLRECSLAARYRGFPADVASRLGKACALCFVLAALLAIGCAWNTAYTQSIRALFGLWQPAAALLAGALLWRGARRAERAAGEENGR